MVFNDTTNKAGLIQDCELLIESGDTGITGNATLLKQFTNLINQAYHKIVTYIIASDTNWKWDDSNYTNFPRGSQNLVSGQQDYALPTATGTYTAANSATLMNIETISILDKSGYEVELRESFEDEATLNTLFLTSGQPQVYKLYNNSVKVWPSPDNNVSVTLTNGLVTYFQRTASEFVSTDTTKAPGIQLPFHRLLSLQASLDYCATRKGLESKAAYIQTQYNELMAQMKDYYSNRNDDTRRRITSKYQTYEWN